jgi:hypothetical protein
VTRRPLLLLTAAVALALVASGTLGFALGDRSGDEPQPVATGWFAGQLDAGERVAIEQLTATLAGQQLRTRGVELLNGGGDALAGIPFRTLRVRLADSSRPTVANVASGRFTARAVVQYRLAIDDVLVGRSARATFRLTPHGPQLVALTGSGQDLWDHEPVDAARSGQVLVLGRRGDGRLTGLATVVEQARVQVDDFWTAPWPRSVVAVLPSTPDLLDPLVETRHGSEQVAVTLWRPARDGTVIRVLFNPDVYDSMPAISRAIVARHEIVHVAQDALPRDDVPVWLVEGLAEYIGYRGTGYPDAWVAPDLLDQVRVSGPPMSWPSDSDFALGGTGESRAMAYQKGWTFCRMVADRYGEDRLVPFYVAVARGSGSPADRLDRAARRVLGADIETVRAQWQDWLRAAA